MPFIGKTPETGAFRLIDSITTSATDTYALTVEGDHYFPESARNLIVSLNGVTQAPEAAYTVSGSHIVFASALTSNDVIDYILVIGEAVDIGTPSDNTVGNAQLKSSLDLSGKTLTFSADQVSGDAIDGGTISNFTSTGIDDNATETAITIDANENVGIGTNAPSAVATKTTLHISDSSNGGALRVGDATTNMFIDCDTAGGTRVRANGGEMLVGTNTAEDLILQTAGQPRLTITDQGGVGIGTDDPQTLLDLSSATTSTLRISNSDTILTEGQITGQIEFYQADSSVNGTGITGKIGMKSVPLKPSGGSYYGNAADMSFYVSGNGNGLANDNASLEAMTIAGTGKVGIGTSVVAGGPASTLHVHSSVSGAPVPFGSESRVTISTNDLGAGNNGFLGSLFFGGQDVSSSQTAFTGAGVVGYSAGDLSVGNITADLLFYTQTGTAAPSEKMRIESNGRVFIAQTRGNTDSSSNFTIQADVHASAKIQCGNNKQSRIYFNEVNEEIYSLVMQGTSGGNQTFGLYSDQGSAYRWLVNNSGSFLVNTTASNITSASVNATGVELNDTGGVRATVDSNPSATFNRKTSDGAVALFRKNGVTNGQININGGNLSIGTTTSGITFQDHPSFTCIHPHNVSTNNGADNLIGLGWSNNRWTVVYAATGSINTSDINEKQDIETISEAEARVALACKGLLRKFRWKDAVEAKDNNPDSDETARIHFGIIAQELQAAFEAEGLDAGRYGMFIHSTWIDEETGEERSRMGVRYSELFAFIISAI